MSERYHLAKRALLTAALVCFCFLGTAAGAGGINLPDVKSWQLDNGMTVAYLGVDKAPVVTVQVWYHVGSKEEARNRRGSAHMFEHMLFKGTEHVRPEEHARHVSRVGGSVNAFTHQDTTAYHNTLPKEYLQFACKLEGERMRNLLLREEMIKTEREVVKEEVRQGEQNPISRGLKRFFEIAFTKHPYAWLPGGDKADLDATTADDLKAFYDAYYQPNNALLVVVGDVTEAEVKQCATDAFGAIPRGAEPNRPASGSAEPAQTAKRREVLESSQIGFVIGGYKIPAAKHDDMYPLQVLAKILSDGESSRLHQRLVRKDKIAVAAAGQLFDLEHPGLFVVFGVYMQPDQGAKVEAALAEEVAKIAKAGPTAKELTKAKNQLQADFVFGLEGVFGLAQRIGFSWINTGDPAHFLGAVDKYSAVTVKDVQRVAKQYLVDTNLTLVVIPPKGAAQ